MLGKLSRWLRILGYDTEYKIQDDKKLIQLMDERILLTRDKELSKKVEKSVLIKSDDLAVQLENLSNLDLIEINLDPKNSRCSKCNGELREATYEEIKNEDEINSDYLKRVWICKNCNQLYWKGKHWETMKNIVDNLRG